MWADEIAFDVVAAKNRLVLATVRTALLVVSQQQFEDAFQFSFVVALSHVGSLMALLRRRQKSLGFLG